MKKTSFLRWEIRRGWIILALVSMTIAPRAYAQVDTVIVASDVAPDEGNLNRVVDSVKLAGTLSSTVFKLQPHGRYVLTDTILVPAGAHLTIVADEPGRTQDSAPPQILCTSNTVGYYTTVGIMFDCFGDITMKNVWLFYANTGGQQTGTNITIEDDSIANLSGKGEVAEFEDVIFDFAAISSEGSGSVSIKAKHFKGFFKNCYWKNCVDSHFRYYGRAISFPFMSTTWHGDSLVCENCTFANLGYVLNQEEGQYYDYVRFNHCTFLNVVMYTFESGWWKKLAVTNSVFVNTYMYGHTPLFGDDDLSGGTIMIDSLSHSYGGALYSFPFTQSDRRILFANSSYWTQKWLRDWMFNNPASQYWRELGHQSSVPIPQPMLGLGTLTFFDSTVGGLKVFPHMNRANLQDSTDPGFLLPPSDTAAIKSFLYRRWWDSSDTLWAWKTQNSIDRKWPLEEDLAYTNPVLLSGGMGRLPLGDLYRWFPDKYTQWKAQASTEYARIDAWLNTGVDLGGTDAVQAPSNQSRPIAYSLCQNYPNPFNPVTRIDYAIPQGGNVTLKVYNILGVEVATLHAGYQQPGDHTVTFDGAGLASGVYFYRLRAGDFVSTRKLVLIK